MTVLPIYLIVQIVQALNEILLNNRVAEIFDVGSITPQVDHDL